MLFPANEVFAVFTVSGVVLAGLAIGPASGLTAGELVAFLFLVALFLEPIAEFTEILDQTQTAVAGWRKVLDVLETPIEVADPGPDGVGPARRARPRSASRRVTYRYPGGAAPSSRRRRGDPRRRVGGPRRGHRLGEVDAGEAARPPGRPDRGRITVHGIALDTVSFASLRSSMVLVPQEGFLFDGDDPRERALRRTRRPTEADVRLAFSELGLDEWLDTLPARARDRGGPAGRVAVGGGAAARVAGPGLRREPDVPAARRGHLRRRPRHRDPHRPGPRVAVPGPHVDHHRPPAVDRRAGRLGPRLEGGRLVEQGTHAELVAAGGVYAGLHRRWMATTT